jgi:hypothetical protein
MKRLKNGIYLLDSEDTIQELVKALNNNFELILFNLMSDPQIYSSFAPVQDNALMTGTGLSFYRNTINVTDIQFLNTTFNLVSDYITNLTIVNSDVTLTELTTLLNSFKANPNNQTIPDLITILMGVVSKYIIGTELDLVEWVCLDTDKSTFTKCRSRITNASSKLGQVSIKVDAISDIEEEITKIKNFLTQYKEEFKEHIHDALDIQGGVIDTDRLGTGIYNVSTYLNGNKTWAKLS